MTRKQIICYGNTKSKRRRRRRSRKLCQLLEQVLWICLKNQYVSTPGIKFIDVHLSHRATKPKSKIKECTCTLSHRFIPTKETALFVVLWGALVFSSAHTEQDTSSDKSPYTFPSQEELVSK